MPGSEIELQHGEILINGKHFIEPREVMHYYKLWYNNYALLNKKIAELKIDKFASGFRKSDKFIILLLDFNLLAGLNDGVDSIRRLNTKRDSEVEKLNIPNIQVDITEMAKVRIPFKGMTVFSKDSLPAAYFNAIRNYEDPSFNIANSNFIVAGKPSNYYSFKNDYYFMMGDNRDIAIDSRHYGLILQKNIIGKYLSNF